MAGSQPTLYLTVAYKDRASQGSPVRASQMRRSRPRSIRSVGMGGCECRWPVSVGSRNPEALAARRCRETIVASRATGAPRKRSTSSGARGGTATPRRRSSAIACSSSGPSTWQGSIRATGRPRCVINTASQRFLDRTKEVELVLDEIRILGETWPARGSHGDLSTLRSSFTG